MWCDELKRKVLSCLLIPNSFLFFFPLNHTVLFAPSDDTVIIFLFFLVVLFFSYRISFLTSSPNWTKHSLMNSKSSKSRYLFYNCLWIFWLEVRCWPSFISGQISPWAKLQNSDCVCGGRRRDQSRHPGGIFTSDSVLTPPCKGQEGDPEQQSHLFEPQIIHLPN